MHDDRFDHLTRRRAALGGLFGASLLALATRLAPDAAAKKRRKNKRNKKKRRKKKCKGGTQKCGKKCRDLRNDADNCGACGNICPTGDCLNGTCTCADAEDCPDICVVCALRLEGGGVCISAIANDEPCAGDADCPDLGSVCSNISQCTIGCKA